MKIIKIFTTSIVVLITIIIISSTFIILLAKFKNKTALGSMFKEYLIHSPLIVKLVNLNEPGDNKYFYFNKKYSKINIKIFSVNNALPDNQIETWLGEIISQTINKKVNILSNSNITYEDKEFYDDKDLNEIRKTITPNYSLEPNVNIIYLSSYQEMPSSAGVVVHRDTIFIFKDTLKNLSDELSVVRKLEKSTLMHEWGHLLGLNHINNTDCIMSEKVEVYDRPPIGNSIVTKYCSESLNYFRKNE